MSYNSYEWYLPRTRLKIDEIYTGATSLVKEVLMADSISINYNNKNKK